MADTIFAKPQMPSRGSPPGDGATASADADSTVKAAAGSRASAESSGTKPRLCKDDAVLIQMIELLFFAYRDFVGDADAVLDEFAFGRAHHRVLYFVNRSPGMTVAELLDILKITKQSLGRVLRDLVDAGFIEQRTGEADRRQRLLHATPRGEELAQRLTEPQMRRISAALAALGPDSGVITSRFLRLMINENDRLVPTGGRDQP